MAGTIKLQMDGRHHDPRRKASQRPLYAALQVLFEEEHAGRAQSCAQEGDQQPPEYRAHFQLNQPFFS